VRLGESLDHRPETNESLKHTVRQGDACLQVFNHLPKLKELLIFLLKTTIQFFATSISTVIPNYGCRHMVF